ncbi:DENN domain protein [Ancylostoma ceylanicum]|uniref:DENN domain protein n=1 Tax=Ancylostoma ceylanicum TaxID=53326 RepID=A0A0D6L9W8_9BILA|nr:DENN domain protein [Ancylostoma ceylanicum]
MATLFDVFCEVGVSGQDGLPLILTKYPDDYNEETVLKGVRQFCFPCGLKDGFSWPGVFYKVLNHVSLIMNNGTKLEVKVPDVTKLPTLREDKFMLEFYNAISSRQMLAIYASLLKERRIIFTGRKLSQLSSCILAASTLLYPMSWQSVFIPVLPESLLDMVMAPMPFLIGVPKQVMESNLLKDLGEVVIVDLEDKTLQSAHNDVADLPSEVIESMATFIFYEANNMSI